MTPSIKILLGALATAILAWFLHGPMGFGARCLDAAAPAVAAAPPADAVADNGAVANTANIAVAAPAPEAPATREVVASCQTRVDDAVKGKTVNFGTGGANVAVDSGPLLDLIAGALKDCAGTVVTVAGHTDAQGGAATNLALSERRAQSVAKALVDRGVPKERLTAKGYGETRPIDADGPEDDPRNRRIEFSVATTGL